jgi:hypothetical protein
MKLGKCCTTQEHESDRNESKGAVAPLTLQSVDTLSRPRFAFLRKSLQSGVMDGMPPRSIYTWFRHSISVTKPARDYPILLILDGHNVHTINMSLTWEGK